MVLFSHIKSDLFEFHGDKPTRLDDLYYFCTICFVKNYPTLWGLYFLNPWTRIYIHRKIL